MKAFLAFFLLVSACTANRTPAVNAPADGAEYYLPNHPAAVGMPRLYPDPTGWSWATPQDSDIRVTDIKLTASLHRRCI